MTKEELIERAKRQLNAGQPQSVWPEDEIEIAACVMQASSAVADEVMHDEYMRPLLQQEYSVTLDANGAGDLLAATGSKTGVAGEILIEGPLIGAVIDNDKNVVQPLRHYLEFLSPQSTVYAYYCLKDKAAILTRAKDKEVNSPADIQSVNGPLIITASYAPASIPNFPPELEDRLVHTLCAIVANKLPPNADA